jgi:hypothetical protein
VRSFLLSLAGVALCAVNVVVLRAAWALGGGPGAWEAYVAQIGSASALALHALLFAISCFFALGFVGVAARFAGERRREVLALGTLAAGGAAALLVALCAGVLS